MQDLDRISFDRNVCHGRACIKGTRIPVSVVLDNLAAGRTEADILSNYPTLRPEDLRAAIEYAAFLAREEVIITPSGLPRAPQA